MKPKDQQLLEEAYQTIYEANFLTKAIDKGKEMIGMGPSKPLTPEQAKQQYIEGMNKLGVKAWESRVGASASYEDLRCPWQVELDVNPPKFKFSGGGFSENLMSWPENKTLPDPDGALTDKNLNAIFSQTKKAIELTKKRLEQDKKDAPEREKREKQFQASQDAKRKADFEAKRWASSPQGQTGIRSNSGMGVD